MGTAMARKIDPVEHAIGEVFGPYAATPGTVAAFKEAATQAHHDNFAAALEGWAIFNESHLRAIFDIVLSGSDIVTAIVGVTFLDNTLRLTLSQRFHNRKSTQQKVFDRGGTFDTVGSKIDALYLLGAFDSSVRTALDALIQVRNLFAHNLNVTFASTDEKMVKAIAALSLHEGKTHFPHHLYATETGEAIGPVETPRDRFIVNLKFCLIMLMRDRVSHHMHSHDPLPEEELRRSLGHLPPNDAS